MGSDKLDTSGLWPVDSINHNNWLLMKKKNAQKRNLHQSKNK